MPLTLSPHAAPSPSPNVRQYLTQQSLGYSHVLFAWMAAASVRTSAFCPLPLLRTLCVPTFSLLGLPVNVGPLVLVAVTKFALPRYCLRTLLRHVLDCTRLLRPVCALCPILTLSFASSNPLLLHYSLRRTSLIGHLAGLAVGYPLAWGALAWLTPPVLAALAAAAYIYLQHLVPSTFPGYGTSPGTTVNTTPAAAVLVLFLCPLVAVLVCAPTDLPSLVCVSVAVAVFVHAQSGRTSRPRRSCASTPSCTPSSGPWCSWRRPPGRPSGPSTRSRGPWWGTWPGPPCTRGGWCVRASIDPPRALSLSSP